MRPPSDSPEHSRAHLGLPAREQFIYEGEETPLLLRKPVVAGLIVSFLALVGLYALATAYFDLPTSFDAEPFRDWVEDRGVLAPVVFVLVMALSVLFAPIPNIPIFIAAGLAWGLFLGFAYSMAGMMLGSVMAFYVARWLGRKHLPKLIGRKMADRLDHLVGAFGGSLVFWARMLPVVNFDWISYLAGMTAIPVWRFSIYSFLGMLLPTFIAVAAGDSLGKDLRLTLGLGGFWVFGIAVSAGYFWWRQRRRAQTRRAEAARASR